MSENIRVCLVGGHGRMGQAIQSVISETEGIVCTVVVDPSSINREMFTRNNVDDLNQHDDEKTDVVIDFTNPECTLKTARWCADHKKPLVTGTTGLSMEQKFDTVKGLAYCVNRVPIVHAPNMSLGVNLIDILLPEFTKVLEGFSIEIVETHHDQKKDSPSGTAERFAKTLQDIKGGDIKYGRAKGFVDSYPGDDIVIHAMRGGTVPGTHEIHLLGPDEEIVIIHRALSRKIFARGAVLAAKWIAEKGRQPGLYDMNDVLGLKKEDD